MDSNIESIREKYIALGEKPETYLEGLLHSKPLTYWDYVEVETLLSLQRPRTNYPDEMIFIMYHQLTEILLKLVCHEIEQVTGMDQPEPDSVTDKVRRVNRYLDICISSFAVMGKGMEPEQYNTFRLSLAPASGFQSAQFRLIELMTTDIHNLISKRYKEEMRDIESIDTLLQHMYWQDAGTNWKTGEKSLMLRLFEEKYLAKLTDCAYQYKQYNLLGVWRSLRDRYSADELSPLVSALKEMDRLFNIDWPIVHLETAEAYLTTEEGATDATGGSDWKKYLHPRYQRRIFFPDLLDKEELENWGIK